MTNEQMCQKINEALNGWDENGDSDEVIEIIKDIDRRSTSDAFPAAVAKSLYRAQTEFECGSPEIGESYLSEALSLLGGKRSFPEEADEQLPESISDDGSVAVPNTLELDTTPCRICNPARVETAEERRRRLLREVVRLQLAAWDATRALEKETGYDIADEDIVDLIGGADSIDQFTDEVLDEFFSNYEGEGDDAN